MILKRKSPVWTLCVLTIPQREPYLERLFDSLRKLRLRRSRWELLLVYNWDTQEEPYAIERRLLKLGKGLPLMVNFNVRNPSIIGGRIQQLALCKSPLICFIDDDVTLHGDILDVLEERRIRHLVDGGSAAAEIADHRREHDGDHDPEHHILREIVQVENLKCIAEC